MTRPERIKNLFNRNGSTFFLEYPTDATPLSEKIVPVLSGGRRQRDTYEYIRYGQAASDTQLQVGYIIGSAISNEHFLLTVREDQVHSDELVWVRFQMALLDNILDLYREVQTAGEAGGVTRTFELEEANVRCTYSSISSILRPYSFGLKDDSMMVVSVSQSLYVQQFDRVYINGLNYQVNNVDNLAYPGVSNLFIVKDERD